MDLSKVKVFSFIYKDDDHNNAFNWRNTIGLFQTISLFFSGLLFLVYWHPIFYFIVLLNISAFILQQNKSLNILIFANLPRSNAVIALKIFLCLILHKTRIC